MIREALRSLADGQPRLLRLSRNPPSDSRRADGIIDYVMTCHSGGTLEIFVEPQLPAPALWIAGTTPIARALVELGSASGFRVTLLDPDAGSDAYPMASRVLDRTDIRSIDPEASPLLVIATQGQWDEEALEGALRRDCAYVGLVASPTRAAALREYLRDQGVPGERIARVRAPAGLDLGAETPEEVALSILAELVSVRHGRAAFAAPVSGGADPQRQVSSESVAASPASAAPPDAEPEPGDIVLLDLVCHMTVEREDVRYIAEHGGLVYAFCSLTCRNRFQKDPTPFLAAGSAAGV